MKKSLSYINVSAVSCLLACTGEFASIYILGAEYPGYSQLKDTVSTLGATKSPVSFQMSTWWIIAGILIIFFGTGFYKAFSGKGRNALIAAWFIILYGIGEGIASGAFKANHLAKGLTTSLVVHNAIGGIGVVAILLLPLVMKKLISRNEMPAFYRFSTIIFIGGIITVLLFLFRYSVNANNFFAIYKGLWQRLFMLNTYIYLATIAVIMIKKQRITSREI